MTLWLGAVSCFLMAKSYVIVWMILWAAAISLFLMAVVDGLDGYAEPSQWDLSVALAPSTEPRNGPPLRGPEEARIHVAPVRSPGGGPFLPLRGPEDACIHVSLAPSAEPPQWDISIASSLPRCSYSSRAPLVTMTASQRASEREHRSMARPRLNGIALLEGWINSTTFNSI